MGTFRSGSFRQSLDVRGWSLNGESFVSVTRGSMNDGIFKPMVYAWPTNQVILMVGRFEAGDPFPQQGCSFNEELFEAKIRVGTLLVEGRYCSNGLTALSGKKYRFIEAKIQDSDPRLNPEQQKPVVLASRTECWERPAARFSLPHLMSSSTRFGVGLSNENRSYS